MLVRCAQGFGQVAFASLLAQRTWAGERGPGAPKHPPARAKRVIFLYMDGGPSQVDAFDPKPRLDRENGQPIAMDVPATQFDNVGTVLRSPWTFRPGGSDGSGGNQ